MNKKLTVSAKDEKVLFPVAVHGLKTPVLKLSNVCKEITSTDLNDKTIASLQPNVSPGRYNLKLQANESNFEKCSAQQYFKNHIAIPFNLLHFWPSVPSFLFAVLLKRSFTVLSGYFYISPNFMAIWPLVTQLL